MEMHQVRYFLAVARHLNFTRAADELRVAQPSLTRAIQKLEAELQGPLFRRERLHTHLTELGRMMLPHLQAAYAAAETAKAQAKRLKMQAIGALALGICSDADVEAAQALVMAVARSLENVSLIIEAAPAGTIERRLLAGELDAAVLVPNGTLHDRFDCRPLCDDAYVVAFPPGHRFGLQQNVALESLDGEPLIHWLCCHGGEIVGGLMDRLGTSPLVSHRSNDPDWVALLVRGGLGCAILPEAFAKAHGLACAGLDGVTARHSTVLATVSGRRHSTALAALIRMATAVPA